jgi:hypothetical protein
MSIISRKIRARRTAREFERALADATPAMRQELFAAAARQNARNI